MFGPNFRDFVSEEQSQPSSERLISGSKKSDSVDPGIEEESEISESKNQEGVKERHYSGDSGIEEEEEFEILGGEGQANPKNKLQCSSFEDGYEIIEVSDLDRIQIAGFSKEKLLGMCAFSKMTYGNNDPILSDRGYKTKADFIEEGYNIIPFYYSGGKCAGFVFAKDREVTIAYRGTQGFDDVITDVNAFFTTSELLPEGGRVHRGFYNAFTDSERSLEGILNDYAKEQELEIKSFRINCTGHSMGAALATITALYLKKVKSAEHVHVATFGSPRVFDSRGAKIYEELLGENTIRVTNLSDPIPMFPSGSMGFKHVGKPLKIKTGNFIVSCFVTDFCVVGEYYHKTDVYYRCIQGVKPEDFQPDNNVSRYYYLSYVVAVPYCITATTLATPYYLFLNAISSIEQCYFEREIKFADDRRLMSLKDNKDRLVIHALGNAMVSSKDPPIISIGCSINRKNEEVQFNVSNISPYGNNMGLRQLCGVKNVSVKEVPNLINAENHVPGKSAASNLVNELAIPDQIVNEASNERSQHPKPKSTDSQQQQKNVVDKRKNIMDNREASIQGSIGSNHEGGCMHGSDQNKKDIEKELSDAIFSLDCARVKSLVEQLKQGSDNTEQIIREALWEANKTEVGKKDKESKSKLIQIREFLAEELKSIDAKVAVSSVVGSVGGVSTATSDQPVNIDDEKKQVSDQPTAQTTLQVENGSEFEGKDDQRDSPSPKSSANGDEHSSSSSSFVNVPTSGESDTNGSNGDYVKVSLAPGSDSGSSFENIDNEDDNKNPQPAPVPLTPAPGPTPVPLVPKEPAPVPPEPIPLVPEPTPVPPAPEPIPLVPEPTPVPPAPEPIPLVPEPTPVPPAPEPIPLVPEPTPVPPEPGPAPLVPEPTPVPPAPAPAPSMSSLSNKDDVQSNSRQPCTTGKNDPAPQGTKASKWPVVVASALAIAGIALGVAIAVYLQMLAAGIVVGACCLVAATVIYYCAPKSSVENSKVEELCKDKTDKGIVIGS